jgi:pilus assembly protein CpaE
MKPILESSMKHSDKSVLLMSDNPAFTEGVVQNFFNAERDRVQTEPSGFQEANGRGYNLAFSKDVVLFEAQPDNEPEMQALADLLKARAGDTVFLGISDNDMSIGKARKLREIGVDDVLPMSITKGELNSVIAETLRSRREKLLPIKPPSRAADAMIIAVTQARGGIGSTTYAVNLACQLMGQSKRFRKSARRKVALLDFDMQFGNANVFLDLEDNGAFQKMVEDHVVPDESYARGMMQHHPSGLDVLNAPTDVMPLNSLQPEAIGALIDALGAQYDYLVLDLPRALVDWLEPVIKKSSRLHLVMDTSVPCIRHAKRLIDFYQESQIGLPVDLIVNREAKPLLKSSVIRDAEAVLDHTFSHWLPEDSKACRRAVDLGKPVSISSANSAFSKACSRVANSTVSSFAKTATAQR